MDALFSTEPFDHFKNVSHNVLNNLYEIDDRVSIECPVTEGAQQEIKQLIINCNFDLDEVADIIKVKSWDPNKINYFVATLQEKRADLLYSILTHSTISHNECLSSFNWVMKLVLGTSELKSLRYPLLQLVLHTRYNGKEKRTIYEMNKEALSKIINILENI